MASTYSCFFRFIIVSLSVAICCGAQPWEQPFTKDTGALLRAAAAIKTPKNAGVVVLLDERRYSIDSVGRTTSTLRRVYRVATEDAVADWASIEQEYAPWHERKPELRARVLSPDGAVNWLDEKTTAEVPARQFDASIFSDNRVLRAPWPAVKAGAVVEYELIIRETAPALTSGVARRVAVDQSIPTERFHVVVDAATGITLNKFARLIPPERIHVSESKKGSHIEIDMGPLAVKEDWEGSVPFDVATGPVFEFSTARSWQAVAAEYETIVNRQILHSDLQLLIPPAPRGEERLLTITRLVTLLHQKIRYTGVEFGEAAIMPRTPSEVLARGYGDCKDKAALLVGLLRAAGFQASVALLDPGAGLDVSPDVPGLGLFTHAIVYLDAPKPLWIDATATAVRVGDLPLGDQGRLALIARAATVALVKTPESQAADNRTLHTLEIRLSEQGRARLVETSEGTGSFESQLRELYGDPTRVKEILERQMKSGYKAASLGAYSATHKDDFSRPFRVSAEALNTPLGYTADDEAVAVVVPGLVFSDLAFPLRTGAASTDGEERKKRREDFVFTNPYRAEYRFRIVPPELFRSKSLPASENVNIGSLTYSRSCRSLEDGSVEALFRFDTGKRRLTAVEFEAARERLQPLLQQGPESIGFVSAPAEALALGDTKDAVKLVVSAVSKHPDSAGTRARLVRVLIATGDGDSAREAGRRAVALDGKSSVAWQALAWANEHDSFGRQYLGAWNRDEAERALRKAVELDTDGMVAPLKLAELLERNADGAHFGVGARLKEAIAIYRAFQKKTPNPTVQQELVLDLLFERRLLEAEQESRTLPDSNTKQSYGLAIVCLREGAARAIIDSQSSYPDVNQRANLLIDTARLLFQMRCYGPSAELAKAAQRLSDLPASRGFAELVGKMKPHEEEVYPPSDPRLPVRRLLVSALSNSPDMEQVRKLFTRSARDVADSVVRDIRDHAVGLRSQFERVGVAFDVIVDALSGAADLQKEGDDASGYRISTPVGGLNGLPFAGFVVKEEGEYRILASQDQLAPVGQLVLDLLRAHDLTSAQKWLDRIVAGPVEVQVRGRGNRVVHTAVVRNLWSGVTKAGRNAESAKVSAATLVAQFAPHPESAIEILKAARAASTNRVERGNLELALCDAYQQAHQWSDMLAMARQLEGNYAVSQYAFRYMVAARMALKQWKELDQDAQARLKTAKNDEEGLHAAVFAAMARGDRASAARYLQSLMAQEWVGADSRALNGWYALLNNSAVEPALKRFDDRAGCDEADPSCHYLIGLLQVSAGQPDEARRSLTNGIARDSSATLDPKPWVLLGKIQEAYGLPEGASRAYAKARVAKRLDETSDWTLALIPTAAKASR
jgi:tetratricopeptide (TPR) repeat protein